LYIVDTKNVTVNSYVGNGNATGAANPDVRIEGDRTTVNSITSVDSASTAVLVRVDADHYHIGSIVSYNVTGVAVSITSTGIGRIDSVVVEDDQGGSETTTKVFDMTSAGKGSCGSILTNLDHNTTTPILDMAASNYDYIIESFMMNGGVDPHFEVVTLANASSTAVTNTNIMRVALGGGDYLHPIIQVMNWDSASAALTSDYRVVDTDYSSGTGFTILQYITQQRQEQRK